MKQRQRSHRRLTPRRLLALAVVLTLLIIIGNALSGGGSKKHSASSVPPTTLPAGLVTGGPPETTAGGSRSSSPATASTDAGNARLGCASWHGRLLPQIESAVASADLAPLSRITEGEPFAAAGPVSETTPWETVDAQFGSMNASSLSTDMDNLDQAITETNPFGKDFGAITSAAAVISKACVAAGD